MLCARCCWPVIPETSSSITNVAYRMSVPEYRSLCPFVDEIEKEWGSAPGKINSDNSELLIQGIQLGNIFIGVQPTFGFEDDPMRLLMSRGGAPHHGFAAFYTYLENILGQTRLFTSVPTARWNSCRASKSDCQMNAGRIV